MNEAEWADAIRRRADGVKQSYIDHLGPTAYFGIPRVRTHLALSDYKRGFVVSTAGRSVEEVAYILKGAARVMALSRRREMDFVSRMPNPGRRLVWVENWDLQLHLVCDEDVRLKLSEKGFASWLTIRQERQLCRGNLPDERPRIPWPIKGDPCIVLEGEPYPMWPPKTGVVVEIPREVLFHFSGPVEPGGKALAAAPELLADSTFPKEELRAAGINAEFKKVVAAWESPDPLPPAAGNARWQAFGREVAADIEKKVLDGIAPPPPAPDESEGDALMRFFRGNK